MCSQEGVWCRLWLIRVRRPPGSSKLSVRRRFSSKQAVNVNELVRKLSKRASANQRQAQTRTAGKEGGGRSSVPANHEGFGQTSAARQTLGVSDWRRKEGGVAHISAGNQPEQEKTKKQQPTKRRPGRRQVQRS